MREERVLPSPIRLNNPHKQNSCCWGGTYRHWLSLIIAFQMMLVAGMLYSFSAFADAIKAQLQLTDNEATMGITVANFGFCFAAPSGYFVDYFGPKPTATVGGILSIIGFIPLWLVVDDNMNINPIWVYLLYFIVGEGSIFTYCAAIKMYQNFTEEHQGKIIGILDCGFGLSAFIFALIYNIAFNKGQSDKQQNLSGFLLFSAIVMAISNLLGVAIIKLDKINIKTNDQNPMIQNNAMEVNEVNEVNEVEETENVWNILKNIDFLLLFASFLMIQASGLLYMNNISYICKAIHRNSYTVALTVLLPLSSAISRFCIGFLSDWLHPTYSRSFLFATVTVVMFMSQLITFLLMDQLYLSAVLVGSSFGCSWCLCPLIVSEQFGRNNFGLNWGILIMASAFGGLLYQPLKSWIYNNNIDGSTDNNCYGRDCYRITFLVSSIGMIFAVIINMYLARKFKPCIKSENFNDRLTEPLACD